ncbi:hypothetical protein LK07_28650 [Streptomyces pluripotens]|uniref:Uncharacterized protein n=1 Tax=Streptomyces pluripotens TaxID=1355015 RepID=A0A221P6E4_9ACTN|nr:hypothetical protein [Streptomyces pluripotens]ARP73094.1 hypothetical protein LK06_027480 [Streptomyces pluripotens]ASN27345.1 hypothetical protein LK07_28650 [Streptomyces pluripotens]
MIRESLHRRPFGRETDVIADCCAGPEAVRRDVPGVNPALSGTTVAPDAAWPAEAVRVVKR